MNSYVFPTFLLRSAASIWFEIWGVVDPGKKNSIFTGKFPKNVDFFPAISLKNYGFSRQIFKKFRIFQQFDKQIWFFQANFQKISIFQTI